MKLNIQNVKKLFPFLAAFFFLSIPGRMDAQSVQDPQLREWASLYLDGNSEELKKGLLNEIKSDGNNRFFAGYFLCSAFRDDAFPFDNESVNRTCSILEFNQNSDFDGLINRYPLTDQSQWENEIDKKLYRWAIDSSNYQKSYDQILIEHLRSGSDDFNIAWGLSFSLRDNEYLRKELSEILKDEDCCNQNLREYLLRILDRPNIGIHDMLQGFLETSRPETFDYEAVRFLATRYADVGNYELAANEYERLFRITPFLRSNQRNLAENLYKSGKIEEALELVDIVSKTNAAFRKENPYDLKAVYTAELYRSVGENGKAREIITERLGNGSETAQLFTELYEIETKSQRYPQAIDAARKAFELSQTRSNLTNLMNSYHQDNDYLQVWQLYQQYFDNSKLVSPRFYWVSGDALVNLEESDLRIDVFQQALEFFPESAWMNWMMGHAWQQIGNSQQAVDYFRKSISIRNNNSWVFNRLAESYASLYGNDAEKRYRDEILDPLVENQNAWAGLRTLKGVSAAEIYPEAKQRLGHSWEPYAAHIFSLPVDSEQRYVIFEEAMQNMASFSQNEQMEVYRNFAVTVRLHNNRTPAPENLLRKALEMNDRYFGLGGQKDIYHYNRFELLSALGDKAEASQDLLKALDANPDDIIYLSAMFDEGINRQVADNIYYRYHIYLNRDPWSGTRLRIVAHRHLRWGGSPLIALGLYERIAEIAPQELNNSEYSSAMSSVGDRSAAYRTQFLNKFWGPSASDRYVDWYDTNRRMAQEESVQFNLNDDGSATLYHSDGLVTKYKDHPVSGRAERIQVGNAFVEAEWDEKGWILQKAKASSGAGIRIEYAESGEIKLIEKQESNGETETWTFEYNDAGRLIFVTDGGDHSITITWDGDSMNSPDASQGFESISRMQQIVRTIQDYSNLLTRNRYSDIPSLPYADEQMEQLREIWFDTSGDGEVEAGLNYASYLFERIHDRQEHANQLRNLLIDLGDFDEILSNQVFLLRYVSLWYDYLERTRPIGVGLEDWKIWQTWMNHFQEETFPRRLRNDAEALRQKLDKKPIALLPAARWVPESDLMNPAFWKVHPINSLGARVNTSLQVNGSFVRENGDVVVATSNGLAVNREGFWEWFLFDEIRGVLTQNINPARTGTASTHFLSVAEDGDGRLWIGTQNGLLMFEYGYDSRPVRWRTQGDGLPHPQVNKLIYANNTIYGVTQEGVFSIDQEALQLKTIFAGKVREAREVLPGEATFLLIVSDKGIHRMELDGESETLLADQAIRSAIVSADFEHVLFLNQNGLFRFPFLAENPTPVPVSGQQDIIKTTNIHSLDYFPVITHEGAEWGIAVMTDAGITVYHNSNFEYLSLPVVDSVLRPQVNHIHVGTNGSLLLSLNNSVLDFTKKHQFIRIVDPVSDMLYVPEWEGMFMSTGRYLLFASNDTYEPEIFDYVSSSALAVMQDGSLVTTNGSSVITYPVGSTTSTFLFDSYDLDYLDDVSSVQAGELFNSLIVGSDGTIWATTPSTLFRYTADGQIETFSMFKDASVFPANSDMLSRVIETKDGEIWVVASNEGHRLWQGTAMRGGLLKYNQGSFEVISHLMGNHWFLSSYTEVDDETALVGTRAGFALHQGSRFQLMSNLEDPAYMEFRERNPMLWLTTEGSRFGEESWLFGTPGGVVIYNNGNWFFPENLNRMLPDDARFAERGGRHIHSVAANEDGLIYISTDRGMLVYVVGENDDALLFAENGMTEQAIISSQRKQLIMESEVLLDAIKENPELGKLIADINRESQEITKLLDQTQGRQEFTKRDERANDATGSGASTSSMQDTGSLSRELESRRRNYDTLTRLLELEHHGAFQMLQLNPLDVAQLRHQLAADERIVVYIPGKNHLTIQLIDRDEVRLLQSNIGSDDLYSMVIAVSDQLAGRSYQSRTIGGSAISNNEDMLDDEVITELLERLYNVLLRPIEPFISRDDLTYLVPGGPMNYLPFNALIRNTSPQIEHAVERFTFGVLPSMYLLDLVLRHQPSTSRNAMIIGDPDGTLPGARQEAEDIYELLRPSAPLLLGNAADKNAITRYAADARIVHFATHGKLNPDDPARSFLLLANNQQLGVVDVMQLPLKNTDLVVLSACETGLGTTGLEYATLARAFAHAGAPSILATLWEVPDEPSKIIVTQFYRNLNAGMNVFRAMSEAQRAFLKEHQGQKSPANWAGYVPFGKP